MDAEMENLAVSAARVLLRAPTEEVRAQILRRLESLRGAEQLAVRLRLYEPYEQELVADLLRLLDRDGAFAADLRSLVADFGPPGVASRVFRLHEHDGTAPVDLPVDHQAGTGMWTHSAYWRLPYVASVIGEVMRQEQPAPDSRHDPRPPERTV